MDKRIQKRPFCLTFSHLFYQESECFDFIMFSQCECVSQSLYIEVVAVVVQEDVEEVAADESSEAPDLVSPPPVHRQTEPRRADLRTGPKGGIQKFLLNRLVE